MREMKNIDMRIEAYKVRLWSLYANARAGKSGMDEALRVSKELDALLARKASQMVKS